MLTFFLSMGMKMMLLTTLGLDSHKWKADEAEAIPLLL